MFLHREWLIYVGNVGQRTSCHRQVKALSVFKGRPRHTRPQTFRLSCSLQLLHRVDAAPGWKSLSYSNSGCNYLTVGSCSQFRTSPVFLHLLPVQVTYEKFIVGQQILLYYHRVLLRVAVFLLSCLLFKSTLVNFGCLYEDDWVKYVSLPSISHN